MKLKEYAFKMIMAVLVVALCILGASIPTQRVTSAGNWNDISGPVAWGLAYDSAHNLLYAGRAGFDTGVQKYDGTTWTDTGGGVSSLSIYSLVYDQKNGFLYAGTGSKDVWKYDGTTWTDTGGGVSSLSIYSLVYDQKNGFLYAGTGSKGVWKYDGTTWTDTGGGVSSIGIVALADDSTHGLLYAANAEDGVWKYDGTTWTSIGGIVSGSSIRSLAYDSTRNLLFEGTDHDGVWKYDGATWTDTKGHVSDYWISPLVYDPEHHILYAGTSFQGVWKYEGTDWIDTGGDLTHDSLYCLEYDKAHDALYAGGSSGVKKYDALEPAPASTFYFAEGTCRPNFDTYFCIQNPGDDDAEVSITYMKGDGSNDVQELEVPGKSRTTVAARDKIGTGDDAAHDFSARVECTNGQDIIAERPMYFNYKGAWTGGHDVMGAISPSSTFYFAEGTCRPDFDTYFCIQNPGAEDASVKITYMKGDGTSSTQDFNVSGSSRATVAARDKIGTGDDAAHDFSARVECTNGQNIIAERPMYFNYKGAWTGGHDVVGNTFAASTFYFAEGTCRPDFDTYFCIQNPGDGDAEVSITYMKGDGSTDEQDVPVPENSRVTVNPRDKIGTGDDAAHDLSARVECTNGQNIIAERPMYFNYKGAWTGGHDVLGATSPSFAFYFAEGTCRPGFDPYICIQNPGAEDASVKITYMKGDGSTDEQDVPVPENSRVTVNPRDKIGTGDDAAHDFSARVECTNGQDIIAERPMYFNYKGAWTGGHDVMGFTP